MANDTATGNLQKIHPTKNLKLNALRTDIERVEIVRRDLVITLKSGRKVLIPDGVSMASNEEVSWITFANEEQLTLSALFSEAQVAVSTNTPALWQEISPETVSKMSGSTAGIGGLQASAALAGALALGGGGGGNSNGGNSSDKNNISSIDLSPVFALADGVANNATPAQRLSLTQLSTMGIDTTALQGTNDSSVRLSLLNNVLDGKQRTDVDSVSKINRWVEVVGALGDYTLGVTPRYNLSVIDFSNLGIVGVDANNLASVLASLRNATIASLAELQQKVYDGYTVTFTAISADTGFSDVDRVTSDNTLTFSGTTNATDGTTVEIILNAGSASAISFRTTASNGRWQVAYNTALSDGTYSVDVKLIGANDQVMRSASQTSITVITPGSTSPVGVDGNSLAGNTIALTHITPDDGVINNDFKTSADRLVLNGTSDAADGTHVLINIDGGSYYTTVTGGLWRYDHTAQRLAAGSHQIQVSLTDGAGNVAVQAPLQELVVLDSALSLLSKTTGAISQTANLDLLFSDDVHAVAGKYITLIDESTNQTLETIEVTDTNRVTISGKQVTVNPANNLVIPKTYHALIDAGAFVSSSAMVFGGISSGSDWIFHPVDPATTVTLTGTGVDASNGIHAAELAQLVVTGTVVSPNMSVVTDLTIGGITFISTDGTSSVAVAQANLPMIDANTRVWTLTNDSAWTAQLLSGKTYHAQVLLQSKVSNVPTQSLAYSPTTLVDTQAPELIQVSSNTNSLNIGQTATFTLTFSEDPADSLLQNDFTVSGGSISFLSSTGTTRQVVFTPDANQSNASVTPIQLLAGRFTDAAGNTGTVNASANWPSMRIDTQAPTVLSVDLTGADGQTDAYKSGTLNAGDKLRATVTWSEAVNLRGAATFTVDVGGLNKSLSYASGSGTDRLVFEYTVQAGDLDNVGGVTASANALLLNGGHLTDAGGNHASLATSTIYSNSNTLVIDGGASDATRRANQLIQTFAANNTDPSQVSGTAPTLQDYLDAGVASNTLNASNVALLNSVLSGAEVGSNEVDTLSELQALVDTYNTLLGLADGTDNTPSVNTPGFASYGLLGITGVVNNTYARLLGDVIDTKARADVDTVSELQALADAVGAVMNTARGLTGLSLGQLQLLGLPEVTVDNFAAVRRAIDNTADNASAIDTLSELQTVVATAVTNAANALTALKAFAELNVDSLPVGIGGYVGNIPTLQQFIDTGVSGVTGNNRMAMVDALATLYVDGANVETIAKVQALVDAYASIIALADGFGNSIDTTQPNAAQYTRLGVTGLDDNQALTASRVGMLGEVIDRKTFSQIDTVKEIQTLSDDVTTLFETAAGGNALTLQQLSRLGITNVSANTLADVVAAIQATADDGSGINTYALLTGVITDRLLLIQQALGLISTYAQANTQPNGPFTGTAPSLDDYVNAGVSGVDAANVSAINNALTTLAVNEASVNTTVEVQALVDAYRVLIASANGQFNNGNTRLTTQQYGLLGLTGIDPNSSSSQVKANLLGDVIDRKVLSDIDTVGEIQTMLDAVGSVMNAALGIGGLTIAQFERLGIAGVTQDNHAEVLRALSRTLDDGSELDSVNKLQSFVTQTVNTINTALEVIRNYAQGNDDLTQSQGLVPTLQDFINAGIQGVTSSHLAAINSALATASVDGNKADSISEIQGIVNAYLQIFTIADGLDNVATSSNIQSEYALLGITGVDSNVEFSLLGDVIDVKTSQDVDSTFKLQNLAIAVDAVIRAAAGGQDLTQAQLESLSITGLTADNFPLVLNALNNVPVTGVRYSTLVDLQNLVTDVVSAARSALTLIQNYADSNSASAPATPSGISPTKNTYIDAGVSGVTDGNLSAINDALATSSVFSVSVNTTAKVQTLVDAYRTIFQMADGIGNNAGQSVNFSQLSTLGTNAVAMQNASNASQRLSLLNNLLDVQTSQGVNTINKIDRLIDMVNAIQDQAQGITPSYTLSANDCATMGLHGVTSQNLSAWMNRIGTTAGDGSEANTLAKLQQLFNNSLSLSLNSITQDSGILGNDFITNDNTLSFVGTSSAQDGTVVKITLTPSAGANLTLTTIVTNGVWQATYPSVISDGVYTVTTQLLDASQSFIQNATARTLRVDTSSILLADGSSDTDISGKTVDFTAISPDTGFSSSDFKTSASQLVFSGTSTATDGSHIAVNIDGETYYTTVTNGTWQYDSSANMPLVSGLHKVQAHLIDAAGNIAATSVMRDVIIDDTALTIVSKTTGAIAQTANLVLTFSDNVSAQNNKYISIWDSSSRSIYETIETTDARISISGKTVTINPANDLVLGKNYYATIDRDAFVSSTGVSFRGLTNITEWTFNPVDPSTTVVLAGIGVNPTDGINATELSNLVVTGVVSSTNGLLVTNLEITRLIFTPTDGSAGFTLTTGMPVVDTNTRIWTLANNNSWTSQLVSGKSYTVSAQLEADIGNTHGVSIADSLSSLIDTTAPTLAITSAMSSLKVGQSSTLTFTFSEAPTGFTQSDIVVPTHGGQPIGSISNFSATEDAKVFTAVFTPATNLSLSSSLANVIRTTYTDAVGNAGSQDAAAPSVLIDTQSPTVSSISISGTDASSATKLAALEVGDKIKVSVSMSEATIVDTTDGIPSFAIVVGSQIKNAVYSSGSGTNTLVFYAPVILGDTDSSGGITHLANALSLNGGKLRDALSNDAVLNFSATPAGTNTVVVETNAAALNTLAAAAQNNTATSNSPALSVYIRSGVMGVTAGNLAAINSALNTANVTGLDIDTVPELQALVDAYNAVLALADGGTLSGTPVTSTQLALLGVTGINTLTLGATDVSITTKASLLSSVIDAKVSATVDTVAEIQSQADSVQAVMLAVNGVTSGASALTKAQLEGLGIIGVTDNNLADVLLALANTPNDGSSVNTLPALQYVVNLGVDSSKQAALTQISNFAADNTISEPISGAFAYTGTLPTLRDYANAGAVNIDNNNLASINDALATNDVGRSAVQDTTGVQAVINAYNALFVLADGAANTGTAMSAVQLARIGANIGSARTISSNLALLNQVLDRQPAANVDRVAEIDALASTVNAIQDSVGNLSASNSLTAAKLNAIGLNLANTGNLAGVRDSIAAQASGNSIDTLSELQALIDFYEAAPVNIALSTDSGQSNSDNLSHTVLLTVGAAGAGNTLQYKINNGSFIDNYTAPTTQGTYTVLVRKVSSQGYLGASASLTFTLDSIGPAAWDINTITAGNNSSETTFFNNNQVVAGKVITPNMGAVTDNDVAALVLTVSGTQIDSVNDQLLFGTVTRTLDATSNSGSNQTINTVTGVDWNYTNKVLTLSKNGGGSWSATDLQKIEQGLRFKTSANAQQGDRTLTFAHVDLAGNTGASVTATLKVDTVIGAVDMISGGAVNAAASSYFGINDIASAKIISPTIGLPTDTDIAKIIVTAGGANADTTNDRLLFGSISQTLNGLNASGQGQAIGGVTGINWDYSPTGAANTLLLSKGDGTSFSASEVQAIEKALRFQTSLSAIQGQRTFVFTHMDMAGNTSATGTQTLLVDTVSPGAVDLDTAGGVQSAQTSYYVLSQASSNTYAAVVPNMAAPEESDIGTITIRVTGSQLNDELNVVGVVAGDGTLTVGGVTGVVLTYDNINQTWTFTKSGGSAFSATDVQTIERNVQFRTTSWASQGTRDFIISHTDLAGNTSTAVATQSVAVDFTGPVIDLNTSSNTLTDWAVTNLSTQAAINSPTSLSESTASVSDFSKIASLQIRVRGLRDAGNERLMVNASDVNATWSSTSGSVVVSGTTWQWNYLTSTGTYTFSLSAATASSAQVATLIQSLGYRNVLGNTATDGVRQFLISATDAAGYTGSEAISSMGLNAHPVQPSLANTNAMTPIDGNNDGANGDQFVIHFSEDVRVANITTIGNWTLSNSATLGTGATIAAIDTIWVNGTAYATNFLVTSGTNATYTLTHQALWLNASTVTTKNQYATLPNLTLGGDLTLEAWVYIDSLPAAGPGAGAGTDSLPRIFDLSQGPDKKNLRLYYTNAGALALDYFDDSSFKFMNYRGGTLTTGTWTHIAATIQAVGPNWQAEVFLNGTSQNSAAIGWDWGAEFNNLNIFQILIGKSIWNDGYMKGAIKDVRIYDDARTLSEIQNDMKGQVDITDTNLKAYYLFNGSPANGVPSNDATLWGSTAPTYKTINGTTLTINSGQVVDVSGQTSAVNQVLTLMSTNTNRVGTRGNNTLSGDSSNDYLAGYGGDDTLSGGSGADTFAWLKGDKGSDTVSDFKVFEGDMIDLSGILKNNSDTLGPNSSQATLAKYLQLSQSGDHVILKIDVDGASNFLAGGVEKTITFTNGWLNGLNDTLSNLASKKIINLNYQTATPLVLDLNADGVHTTALSEGVLFDFEGHGHLVQTGWTDGQDGLLVLDLNQDGAIDNGGELFGGSTVLPDGNQASNGFEALRQYDLNLDHVIDERDDVFSRLQVWIDANVDGISTPQELHSLGSLGVATIHLNATPGQEQDNGNALALNSHWTHANDQQHALVDVLFRTQVVL